MKVSNISLAIGVPLNFPMVPSAFFQSFIEMEKPDYIFIREDGTGPIHEMRNNIVERALKEGATHLLMCDVDQVYHPKTIPTLLSRNLPIVGALVHRRYVPFDSLAMKLVDVGNGISVYESIDDWEDGALLEVDATGCGCIMYQMDVFRKIPSPWFKNRKNPDGSPIGEDFGFCQDLKAAGYRIFVDTSVPEGHLATLIINTATNRLYRAMKTNQAKEATKAALKV